MLTKAELSQLRSLREKKHREELGRFVVESDKVVGELLAAGGRFETIYATPEWEGHRTPAKAAAGTLREITADEMARASHLPTPSTVLAVGIIARPTFEPSALNHGLTLALDGVQDPGNVGTLLRVADWYAFDRVLLSPDSADLFHQKVINASMGSFARMTVFTVNLRDALAGVTAPVLGCDLEGDDVHDFAPLSDAVVVVGSEGRGLSPAVKSRVNRRVTIPRFGAAESLNAAVAAAIVCDNLRRTQRR